MILLVVSDGALFGLEGEPWQQTWLNSKALQAGPKEARLLCCWFGFMVLESFMNESWICLTYTSPPSYSNSSPISSTASSWTHDPSLYNYCCFIYMPHWVQFVFPVCTCLGLTTQDWRKPALLPLAAIGSLARGRALWNFQPSFWHVARCGFCRSYAGGHMTESPWGHPSSLVLSRRNCLVVLLVSNTYVRDVFRKWRLALQAMSMPKLELLANGIAPHLRIKNLFPLHGLLAFHVSLRLQKDFSFIQGLKCLGRLTRTQRSLTILSSQLELQVTMWPSSGHWDTGVILLREWNFPVW